MPQVKAYLVLNEQRINLTFQQTTIGRLTTNLIPINDPTVSKNHASINYISNDDRFYIRDMGTVNGTYLNGNKLQANKRYPLKHKDNIQFGKHINLYNFYMVQPQNQKKGKINLKDYCFELDSDQEDKKESGISPPPKINYSNPKKIPTEGRKIKIPNLAQYLQLEDSLLSENNDFSSKNKTQKNTNSKFARQGKISLPKFNNEFEEKDLQSLKKEEENRRNIFLARQLQKQARQQKARALEESKIKLQIQKHKHEEQMLKKQLQLQEKIRQQQQRMEIQKQKMEQNLLKTEQERRSRQKKLEYQQRQKQKRYLQQLQQQKQEQLRRIKQQQIMMRTKTQNAMKQQLQRKKKDLQLEAQTLAKQYQQIYRQTIRKMKNDIEKQENQITNLQKDIEQLQSQNQNLQNKQKQIQQAVQYAKTQFNQINGRNKAFILYASQLQNKLDKLKSQKLNNKQKRVNAKLKQQILNSRKLLYLKNNEVKSIQDQINKLKLQLSFGNKMGQNDMLETLISNHQAIQNYKNVYFEYLRQQKSMQQVWQTQLQENQHLEQQNFSLIKENQTGKKQLISNIKQNISRLTQQRLHMLKCLHYLPEQKKRAAKFLIEEMITMQEQIRTMVMESQQTHEKIQELIIDSQRKKQQDQYLSQLLFGADSTAHHFDNMKIEINTLIDRLQLERDDNRIMKRLKLTSEIQNNQIGIHQLSMKQQIIRNRWRQGLPGQKMLIAQKNPIVFFGDLLTKRQADIEQSNFKISKLEKQYQEILTEVNDLERKKQNLGQSLEKFKKNQIQRVRQSLF